MTDISEKNKSGQFDVFLADVSYFSGKMESYLRFKEIPFNSIETNASIGVNEIYKNTGILKLPAIRTPKGDWLKDTTPMIDWFEDSFQANSIMSQDPATQFVFKLLEDYADEWCWRSAMYYRWAPSDNARFLGERIGKEVLGDWLLPNKLTGMYFRYRQTKLFLTNDGLTEESESIIKNQYISLLDSFSTLLSKQPFLTGHQPTLVDIAFMGPFYRHYFCDPVPAKIMRDRYPYVLAWVTRVWAAKVSNFDSVNSVKISDFNNEGWSFIFQEIVTTYLPYLKLNAKKWREGVTHFDFEQAETKLPRLPVVHYRVLCLEVLEKHYQSLSDNAQNQVGMLLNPFGDIDFSLQTESGLSQEYELPLPKRNTPLGALEKVKVMVTGTPWDHLKMFASRNT